MARTITVDDDEIGTQVKVTIERSNGQVQAGVTAVRIHAHGQHLPDELLSALVPWIGLPPADAKAPRPGVKPPRSPAGNGHRATAPVDLARPAAPPAAPVSPAPALAFKPAATPDPSDEGEPPVKRGRSGVKYANKPSHEQLTEAINLVGASPKALSNYYKVPATAVSNWLAAWRKRNNEVVAAEVAGP